MKCSPALGNGNGENPINFLKANAVQDRSFTFLQFTFLQAFRFRFLRYAELFPWNSRDYQVWRVK